MGRRVETPVAPVDDQTRLRILRGGAQRVLLENISIESDRLERHYDRLARLGMTPAERLAAYEKTLEELGLLEVYRGMVSRG